VWFGDGRRELPATSVLAVPEERRLVDYDSGVAAERARQLAWFQALLA
jgi:hypothetical protein